MTNEEKQATIAQVAIYNILFVNEAVSSEIILFHDEFSKTSLCTLEGKRQSNRLYHEALRYERELLITIRANINFFADCNSMVDELIEADITRLTLCIKQELDKHRIPHSDTLARIESIRALSSLACASFDARVRDLASLGHAVRHVSYLRLTAINYHAERLSTELSKQLIPSNVVINLNDVPHIKQSLLVIDRRLTNPAVIGKILESNDK